MNQPEPPPPTPEFSPRENLLQRLAAIPEYPTVAELAKTAATLSLRHLPLCTPNSKLPAQALTHWFACRDELKARLLKDLDQFDNQAEEAALKRDLAQLDATGKTSNFFASLQDSGEPIADFQDGLKQIFGSKGSVAEKELRLRQILISEYQKIGGKPGAATDAENAKNQTARHLAKLKARGFTLVEVATARHLAAQFKSDNVRAKNQKNAGKRWAKPSKK